MRPFADSTTLLSHKGTLNRISEVNASTNCAVIQKNPVYTNDDRRTCNEVKEANSVLEKNSIISGKNDATSTESRVPLNYLNSKPTDSSHVTVLGSPVNLSDLNRLLDTNQRNEVLDAYKSRKREPLLMNSTTKLCNDNTDEMRKQWEAINECTMDGTFLQRKTDKEKQWDGVSEVTIDAALRNKNSEMQKQSESVSDVTMDAELQQKVELRKKAINRLDHGIKLLKLKKINENNSSQGTIENKSCCLTTNEIPSNKSAEGKAFKCIVESDVRFTQSKKQGIYFNDCIQQKEKSGYIDALSPLQNKKGAQWNVKKAQLHDGLTQFANIEYSCASEAKTEQDGVSVQSNRNRVEGKDQIETEYKDVLTHLEHKKDVKKSNNKTGQSETKSERFETSDHLDYIKNIKIKDKYSKDNKTMAAALMQNVELRGEAINKLDHGMKSLQLEEIIDTNLSHGATDNESCCLTTNGIRNKGVEVKHDDVSVQSSRKEVDEANQMITKYEDILTYVNHKEDAKKSHDEAEHFNDSNQFEHVEYANIKSNISKCNDTSAQLEHTKDAWVIEKNRTSIEVTIPNLESSSKTQLKVCDSKYKMDICNKDSSAEQESDTSMIKGDLGSKICLQNIKSDKLSMTDTKDNDRHDSINISPVSVASNVCNFFQRLQKNGRSHNLVRNTDSPSSHLFENVSNANVKNNIRPYGSFPKICNTSHLLETSDPTSAHAVTESSIEVDGTKQLLHANEEKTDFKNNCSNSSQLQEQQSLMKKIDVMKKILSFSKTLQNKNTKRSRGAMKKKTSFDIFFETDKVGNPECSIEIPSAILRKIPISYDKKDIKNSASEGKLCSYEEKAELKSHLSERLCQQQQQEQVVNVNTSEAECGLNEGKKCNKKYLEKNQQKQLQEISKMKCSAADNTQLNAVEKKHSYDIIFDTADIENPDFPFEVPNIVLRNTPFVDKEMTNENIFEEEVLFQEQKLTILEPFFQAMDKVCLFDDEITNFQTK
uniref:Uncharacterized protein n=1 Tax=Corethron hystrix TaxID=216773 RepID=A0A7S1BPY6_9STRA|mmetsp:Transcript_35464/g.82291  ORF Transcript_35464/g.82291 Transcript_35464/m.82291 type:complete len:995 (+) Transcript_35464:1204-4188(+)